MINYTLTNGIRVFFTPDDRLRSATVGVWVAAGCKKENADNNGISHFIEHIVFKGSHKRTGFEIAEGMDEIGASVNAYTTKEYTFFYVRALDYRILTAADILFDMITSPRLDEKDIETEKGVIFEEIYMCEDDPSDVCYELNESRLFQGNSLSREILGSTDTVKNITSEKILSYMAENYVGENIIIGVSGSFDEKSMREKIEEFFSPLSAEGKKCDGETLPFNAGFALKQMPTEQTHIMLTFPGVPISHDELYALQICAFILGTGTSSMLNQRIREQLGLVYSIDCWLARYAKGGYTAVSMSLAPKSEEMAIKETVKIITGFSEAITERKVEIAKEKLISSLIMSREQPQSKFSAVGYNTLLLGRVVEDDEIIEEIKNVKIEDVKNAHKKYFTMDKMLFTAVGKVKSEEEYRKILSASGEDN
ncbi:MAG: insulinase family protein [Clostridia bacterium]|nr:insulinase family protein [Clostridia bacterium]